MTKRDFGEYENDEKKISLWGANIMEPRLLAIFASLTQMSTLNACPVYVNPALPLGEDIKDPRREVDGPSQSTPGDRGIFFFPTRR